MNMLHSFLICTFLSEIVANLTSVILLFTPQKNSCGLKVNKNCHDLPDSVKYC